MVVRLLLCFAWLTDVRRACLKLFHTAAFIIILYSLKQSYSTQHSMILKDQNARDHSAWTIENGDPMHDVCIPCTQYTSHMGTVRVKQEQEADIRIIVLGYSMKSGRKQCGHEGEKSQPRPN